MNTLRVRLLLAGLALASSLPAQTWIGGTSFKWEDAANWDTGVVPDGPAATATFSAAGLDPTYTTDFTAEASHTLGGLVFAADARRITLYAGHDTDPTTFAFTGDGVTNKSSVQQYLWLTAPTFSLDSDITLTFRNQAAVTGDVRLIAIGSNRRIEFRDQSSAGSASIEAAHADFYDQSTAAHAVFDQNTGSAVTFHDHSTAGTATLPGYSGSVTFADASSAGSASLVRPQYHGSSAQAFFRDDSTAATATLNLYHVEFSGNATAAAAVINTAGSQEYSSHGAYSTLFATTDFRDHARAADAALNVNALGTLSFLDDTSAERATINTSGRLIFGGRAALGSARVVAGSGAYYGDGGYNQPAPSVATGGVLFRDQATGGGGRIELASAGAWLDFSGLTSGTGTTGRAALPANVTAAPVVADDAPIFSVGTITNTAPGGTIYLGSTALALGILDRDMTLDALVRDTGGAYGSSAGEPLRGGSLLKLGAGTLTISNAANDYSGTTRVTAGTLDLAGGRINDAEVFALARLTGTGTVRGVLTNRGLVSPGHSPGTITVTGDYVQTAGGRLLVELGATSDHLIIGGAATLAGTLVLAAPNGYVPVGNTAYNFLTAGSVSGTFDAVVAPTFGAALTSQVVYAPTGVQFQVTQHSFTAFGGTSPAGTALGAHLDATLASATGDYRALLAQLNTLNSATQVAVALDALSPDRYAALAENSFLAAASQQAARDRRLAALRDVAGHSFDLSFDAGQRRTRFDSTPGLPEASGSLSGGTATAVWRNDGVALGLAVAQEDGDLTLDSVGSRADLKSVIPAVFFQYAGDRWFANAAAAFAHDDYDLRRHVAFAGFDQTAAARTSGTRQDFAVNVGTLLHAAHWTFAPQVGVLASRWQLDGFTETGAAGANLALADQSLRSLRTRVGVEAAAHGDRFTPRLSVYWLHDTGDDRSLQAGFAGAGSAAYAAPGRPAARNLVQASIGCDWRLGRHATLNLVAAGAWGDRTRVTSDLSAGFRWEF